MKYKGKKYSVGASIARPQLAKPSLNLNTKYQIPNTNQKGITVISLVITIVIMLILASVTIYVGTDSIEHTKMVSFVSSMQLIQKKVEKIVEEGNYMGYGADLTTEQETELKNILEIEDVSNFKYFDSHSIKEQLGIENIEDEIVINFITREVISLLGFEYEGVMYYSQYNLPGGQKLVSFQDTSRTVSVGEITSTVEGLNGTITINNISITNGSLYYGKEYEQKNSEGEITKFINWKLVTNKTVKTVNGESITTPNITESGKYYIKLVDNITGVDNVDTEGNYPSIILRLTNSPKLKGNLDDVSTTYNYSDLTVLGLGNWAYATDNTDAENPTQYVWIPRFAYETEDISNIEFLRGTSDVTSSGGYIDENWTIPPQFTEDSTELIGVWVKVDSIEEKDKNIIDILENATIL